MINLTKIAMLTYFFIIQNKTDRYINNKYKYIKTLVKIFNIYN